MKKTVLLLLIASLFAFEGFAQKPKARRGWIDLFNGKDLLGWHLRKADGPNGWKVVEGGVYENTKPS
ncbi:MAG TPA: hypothetical protein VGK99_22625, partial [Acidobacteriota bacterium]